MQYPSRTPAAAPSSYSSNRLIAQLLTALTTLCVVIATHIPAQAGVIPIPGPTIGYEGGFTVDDPDNNLRTIPGVFTWKSHVPVVGSGWRAYENVYVYIYGPLNTPGVTPTYQQMFNSFLGGSVRLPEFPADQNGNLLVAHFVLPYQLGDGIQPPGLYQIYAERPNPQTVFDRAYSEPFNLSPDTIVNNNGNIGPNWGYERGARDGFLGDTSPERTDPEWVSVWTKRPVGLYATVAATDSNGGNQPAHIAYHDYPWTHYGHDIDLHLVPDDDYRWVMATANFRGRDGSRETGRIEWEWETQNNGSPFVGSYGHGNIGIPLFATPTAGDRIYTVGSWVLDNGHPDEGDRSEIHPPRMIATMRKRHTAVPFGGVSGDCKTRASQVDIYISGHGGGVNHYYDELERMLDNNGAGGGQVRYFMPGAGDYSSVFRVYQQPGPESSIGPVNDLLDLLGFLGTIPYVGRYAGPSALSTDSSGLAGLSGEPWVKGPEERRITDMDYEFDVPLPAPPAGATHPLVMTTQYPWHTTHLEEVITYIDPDWLTGLPTKAHIKIPYAHGDGDNRVYARTLNFYWDKYSDPGARYLVTIDAIKSSRARYSDPHFTYYLGPQPLYMWADVSGQWMFLTDLNQPKFLQPVLSTSGGVDTVDGLNQARFEVYLDPTDSLRVFTHGYAQRDMDYLFGNQNHLNAYDAGLQVAVAAKLGSGDNQDIGGAVYDVPLSAVNPVGSHTVDSDRGGNVNTVNDAFGNVPDPVFSMDFTVSRLPSPPHLEVRGRTDFGAVCLGSVAAQQMLIGNTGDEPLYVGSLDVSGGGYSGDPHPPAPYTLPGNGNYRKLDVIFAPTDIHQGAGALTVASADVCQPSLTVPLSATVLFPELSAAPPSTVFPATVTSCSGTQAVTVSNTGSCDLVLSGTTTTGTGFSIDPSLFPVQIAPGTSTNFPVKFAPTSVARAITGTLTFVGNTAVQPSTSLNFCGEGTYLGVRVLVVKPDGTPYPTVDQLQLFSHGVKREAATRLLKDLALQVIDPPTSCQTIKQHFEMPLLVSDPADPNGNYYELHVQVGGKSQTVKFTMAPCEFKQLVVTVP